MEAENHLDEGIVFLKTPHLRLLSLLLNYLKIALISELEKIITED